MTKLFNQAKTNAARYRIMNSLIQQVQGQDEILETLINSVANVVNVPAAVIVLAHRQKLLSVAKIGIEVETSDLVQLLRVQHLGGAELVEINDVTLDSRFGEGSIILGKECLRFYAGASIKILDVVIGHLCVLDKTPRTLNSYQRRDLLDLAKVASDYLQGIYEEIGDSS